MKPKIVIVGAGFGGIEIAKAFKNDPVEVLLIDQNNYHNFQPLMYQIATGGLEPDSIAYPVRRIFRDYKNVSFRMAEVHEVVPSEKVLKTAIGEVSYDYLVVATGSKNNYFNLDDVKEKLLTLKSVPDALNMRSFIFQNLEKALVNPDEKSLERILNVAIVGGGPSGIELAGALAEMKKHVIPKDFPDLDISKMTINLYEASDALLGGMAEVSSRKSKEFLEQLGVKVNLESKVSNYDGDTLTLEDGTSFQTNTVIWAAGVQGAPFEGFSNAQLTESNRLKVDAYNAVSQTDKIFAIGDVAALITEENPKGLPMLAPVAKQQGKQLANNIKRAVKNREMKPFDYFDKGTMATIGRNKAVVELPGYKFQGFFAWLVWMFVHIMLLVGFRNKLYAFMDWSSNYLTYDRPLGLIIRPYHKK